MKKSLHAGLSCFIATILLFSVLSLSPLQAQFPYLETFKNNTAPGMVFSGSAFLTSGVQDPSGDGYLRLTDSSHNQTGSAYNTSVFNSNQGLIVEFEYFVHDGIPFPLVPPGNTGDGFSFFLFNGDSAFQLGAFGGSLGYANKNDPPTQVINGMADAYIGIGLDEFGNFSSTYEGKNGGPGYTPSAVAIRGPGDGQSPSYYVYQTGQQTNVAPYNFLLADTTTGRDPLPSGNGYRKVKIEMNPVISGGNVTGYLVTVKITTGGASPTEHVLINNFAYNFIPPPHLKFGFSASTGLATTFHEIRNLGVNVFDPAALAVPTAENDIAQTCSGAAVSLRVTDNDFTPNGGGTAPYPAGVNINRATIDFDGIVPGAQQQITLPAIGTFQADTSGIVTFTPVPGFTGTANTSYFITDVYGKPSSVAGAIAVTVTNDAAPALTVVSPQNACTPSTIDITQSPSVWSVSPAGGTTTYVTDALGTASIIDPTAIAQTGTYYIKHTGANGCVVIKPIAVTISSPTAVPLTVNGFLCGPGSVTLQATGAAAGEDYHWYDAATAGNLLQDGGPTYNTPTLSDTTDFWVSKFSPAAPGCESNRVLVTAFINPLPVAANAGPSQVLNNVSLIQLAGNTPPAGESGLWTLVSGPNIPTILEPTHADATVTNLSVGTYQFTWTTQSGTCTSSSQVSVQVLSLLPVTLVQFTAALQQQQVLLKWTTATETDNSVFIIERSTNGLAFDPVGQVPGHGNSNQLINYSYNDNIAGITATRLYYRLKQVDKDGRHEYSRIASVILPGGQMTIQLSPNPFSDQLHIRITGTETGKTTISLLDGKGSLVSQHNFQLVNGTNDLNLVLKDLAPGIYYLKMVQENKPAVIKKIICKR